MRGHKMGTTNQLSGRGIVVRIRSFIEPDLFDNNVPYHSDLFYQSALEIRHYFCIFRGEQRK